MRTTILLCILFLSCGFAFSQSFSVGVIGGFSNTDVLGLNTEVQDKYKEFHRLGFIGGAFVNRALGDKTSLQMELLYATKGSLSPADSTNNYLYYKLRLNYLEVPVLYKFKMRVFVNDASPENLEFEMGLSFAVLLSSWQESNNGLIPFDPTSISNKPFNSDDFLINLGLNYYFSKDFSLDVRFTNSIVPARVHTGDVIGIFSGGDFNSAINYSFRYTFH